MAQTPGWADAQNLTTNLRFLTSQYRSVSEACRVLDINRQQFNKYLSGSVTPSQNTLRRLCDHFIVDEEELFLPPRRFRSLFRPLRDGGREHENAKVSIPLAKPGDPRLAEYFGYYYSYYPSFSRPGLVLKAFVQIYQMQGSGYFRSIERVHSGPGQTGRVSVFKYSGRASFLRERIFLAGQERLGSSELTQTILIPSYASGIEYLFGIHAGCAASAAREPMASRIVLESCPRQATVRRLLKGTGVFDILDAAVPDGVRKFLVSQEDQIALLRGMP